MHEFLLIRWLDNGPAVQRLLDVMQHLKTYVAAVREKKVPDPKTKSFEAIERATQDPTMDVKLHFILSLTQDLEFFLKRHQTDAPMIPFVAKDLFDVLTSILRRFLTEEFVA